MILNILQRMLLKELIKVFILSLIGLTGLFLLAGLIHEASQRGLSPDKILAIIPLLVPNMLPYTIPATTLFATCVVYGRFSHDNEYLAIKAAGVNPLKMLRPAVVLGVCSSMVTLTLYLDLIPSTQRLLRETVLADSEEVVYTMLNREKRLKFEKFPFVMFVREVQGKRLHDVIFKRWADPEKPYLGYDLVARAREARITIDQEQGMGYIDMDNCVVYGESQSLNGNLRRRRFEFPLPEELNGKETRIRPMALTWKDLRVKQNEVWDEGQVVAERWREALERQAEVHRQLHATSAELLKSDLPNRAQLEAKHSHLIAESEQLKIQTYQLEFQAENHYPRLYWNLVTEMELRPAIAFGCLFFALIGAPVGLWFSRADYLSSFVICFLPVIIVYYPLLLSGSNLAREGKVPVITPVVWIANGVLMIASLVLIRQLMRR